MIPITRKELYLNKIVGNNDYETPEKPITTEEFFFAEILGEAVQAPEPLTRYQMYLAKIAGREIEIPYPETRLELFLAKACGMDIETPTPITREEIFWSNYSAIVDFEVEGVPPLTYKSIEGTLENYRIYGNTVNGENVGDLITEGEHAGEYKVPVTVEGKNLLQNTATSQTINGVTFKINSDGSVTCNGTATAITFFSVNLFTYIANTSYILSGCPKNGSPQTFLAKVNKPNAYYIDTGNGVRVTLLDTATYGYVIRIASGYTCNNLTFYPMIRKADIEDDTYEPYRTPVTTPIYLPEQIKKVGDEAEYIDYGKQKQHRVRKNLINSPLRSYVTSTGITVTLNADRSVTLNGTADNTVDNYIYLYRNGTVPESLLNKPVIISGGHSVALIRWWHYNGTNIIVSTGSDSAVFTASQGAIEIFVAKGTVLDNVTVYPMIRFATIEDDTYEPYIENTDLNVTLPALPTLAGTNVLTVGTVVQPSKVYIKGQKERD